MIYKLDADWVFNRLYKMEVEEDKQMKEDYVHNCPVCFGLMAEPVTTPWNHTFCYTWISKTLEKNTVILFVVILLKIQIFRVFQ